ncbi:MAG: ketopantoate reductase family protein, partial [Burkholderiales bacterium]
MKIAVLGSGGVGGFYGGRLAHAGYDVSFVARGAHLAAMRSQGLTIENAAQGDIHVPRVKVTDDPATIGEVDLVLIAVKLWDTEAAARAVKPIVGAHTAVVSLQNGVIKDDIMRREFGAPAVMGGVAYVGTHISRPGVILQTGTLQRLVFGEYDGTRSLRARQLLEALLRAGIEAELSEDIRRTLWEKYVFLVGLSGTTTTMRMPIGAIRENPQTRAFLLDLMKETVAVGRAHGVNLPEDYAELRLAFADTVAPDMSSSMHHDLEHGNRLEVAWLSGGVVQLGRAVGVETPANRAVWDIL